MLLLAAPASADALFTLDNSGGAFGLPAGTTFGTIRLHQMGAGTVANPYVVQVTVTVNVVEPPIPPGHPCAACGYEVLAGTGAGYPITWNITGDPNLTVTLVGPLPTSQFVVQDNAVSGKRYKASPFTGGNCPLNGNCFDYAIALANNGGSSSNPSTLVFDVTKSGGLLLSDFTTTSAGYYFGVDISLNGSTAVVGTSHAPITVTSLPEPATIALFAAGAGGLAAFRRRRKKKAA